MKSFAYVRNTCHQSTITWNSASTWSRQTSKSSRVSLNRALEGELFWLTNWMKRLRRAKASASLTTGRRLVLLNYAQVGVHRAPKRSIAATLSNPASNPKARPQHSRLRTLSRMGFRHFKTFTTKAFIPKRILNQTFHKLILQKAFNNSQYQRCFFLFPSLNIF